MNWGNVLDWKAHRLDEYAGDIEVGVRRLRQHAEDLDDTHPRHWRGESAVAATATRRELVTAYENLAHAAEPVGTRIAEAADEIRALQGEQAGLAEFARAYLFRIEDSGAVVDAFPDVEWTNPDQLAHRASKLTELEEGVAAVLETAARIDGEIAAALRRAHTPLVFDRDVGADGEPDRVALPAPDTDPAAVGEWWHGLSAGEQNELITTEAGVIGNLDGIPYAARHAANLARLPEEYERLEGRLDELKAVRDDARPNPGGRTSEYRELSAEIEEIEGKLTALDELDDQAADGNQILSLDTSGERVRSAVGIGDVDAAENVAVYSPGKNSAVEDNMERYVDELGEVNQHAREILRDDPIRGSEQVATVVWMDYHAPHTTPQVFSGARAESGGERLAGFMDGVQGSRAENPPDRLAGVGHSYGSTTTGKALKQSNSADAFVAQGSPGWGGSDDLRVPEGQRYNLSADWDGVANHGHAAHGGSIIERLTGSANPSADPTVRELSTDDAINPLTDEAMPRVTGHTDYTEANEQMSTSEFNTAAAIVGADEHLIDQE